MFLKEKNSLLLVERMGGGVEVDDSSQHNQPISSQTLSLNLSKLTHTKI